MREEIRLTKYSHGAGCACKLSPQDLAQVLDGHQASYPDEIVVSGETRDDAAVYRLPDGRGLVQTVDFFTPIVDDPFDWGRIACANAISDVYAMGGQPVIALNIAAWPVEELPLEMLRRVLDGGAKVAAEAGVSIVGGHTIHDPEPKYGMAVTGFVDIDRVVRNSTAPPDASLFLTKPLGLGMITTALKRGKATAEQVAAAVDVMTTLNSAASEAMVEAEAEAATDVTGFGLLGHLHFMLAASGVSAELDASAVPLLPGTIQLAEQGTVSGGTRKNHAFVGDHVDWGELGELEQLVLADAQTSGGLLIAATDASAERLVEGLQSRKVSFARIGRTHSGKPGRITVSGHLRDE
jgi:selenide,water dikinase